MWFDIPPNARTWVEAEAHLRAADPRLGAIIDRVGPCTLAPRRDYFCGLAVRAGSGARAAVQFA